MHRNFIDVTIRFFIFDFIYIKIFGGADKKHEKKASIKYIN